MDRRGFIFGLAALVPGPAFAKTKKKKRPLYAGSEVVEFLTPERPGTIIINTDQRALFHVIGSDTAIRYGVAVGKEGFDWAGIAKVGAQGSMAEMDAACRHDQAQAGAQKMGKWHAGRAGQPVGCEGAVFAHKKGRHRLSHSWHQRARLHWFSRFFRLYPHAE